MNVSSVRGVGVLSRCTYSKMGDTANSPPEARAASYVGKRSRFQTLTCIQIGTPTPPPMSVLLAPLLVDHVPGKVVGAWRNLDGAAVCACKLLSTGLGP